MWIFCLIFKTLCSWQVWSIFMVREMFEGVLFFFKTIFLVQETLGTTFSPWYFALAMTELVKGHQNCLQWLWLMGKTFALFCGVRFCTCLLFGVITLGYPGHLTWVSKLILAPFLDRKEKNKLSQRAVQRISLSLYTTAVPKGITCVNSLLPLYRLPFFQKVKQKSVLKACNHFNH